MKSFLLTLIIFAIPYITAAQQKVKIIDVLDANAFLTADSTIVSISDVFIPSKHDNDVELSKIAQAIIEKLKQNYLNKELLVENYNGSIYLFKEYPLGKENLLIWYLSNGYAYLKKENKYLDELYRYQNQAMKNSYGIWASKNYLDTALPKKEYEKPYLSFLIVSAAFFAISYDNFSTASDISKDIDNLKRISSNIDVSHLEDSKTRKSVVGVTSLVAGIITTLFALQEVEVKASQDYVTFSFNF